MQHSYHPLYHEFICRRTLETVECYPSTRAVWSLDCISFRFFFVTFTSVCNHPETEGGRHSVVGIKTLCGLDFPGLETLRGQDFLDPYRRALRHTQSPVQWIRGVSLEGKSARAWPFQGRDRVSIELNLCLPYIPPWHVMGQPLPLILPSPGTETVGVNGTHLNPEERREFCRDRSCIHSYALCMLKQNRSLSLSNLWQLVSSTGCYHQQFVCIVVKHQCIVA